MKTVSESEEDADWTKQSWDFPPYGSPEFDELVPDREAFKKSLPYKNAVEQGLIVDDKWDPKMELTLRFQRILDEQAEEAAGV